LYRFVRHPRVWLCETRNIGLVQQLRAGRSAILAPGGNYGAEGPLLMYARLAVQRRGGHVHPIVWELPEGSDFSEQRRRVISQVESAVEEMTAATGAAPLVIGKSLGSLAAPLVADRGLAAVWFTPLLTDEPTAAALRRAASPCLLVGGTADQVWDGRAARSLAAEVVEIDDADHGMFVPGRLAASATVLGQVITAVEDFLDHIVWPLAPSPAGRGSAAQTRSQPSVASGTTVWLERVFGGGGGVDASGRDSPHEQAWFWLF